DPVPETGGYSFADFDADGRVDLLLTNQARSNKVYLTNRNGTFQDVTASLGLASPLAGTTEHFIQIGQSILALLAALVGGLISRRLYAKYRRAAQAIASSGISVG